MTIGKLVLLLVIILTIKTCYGQSNKIDIVTDNNQSNSITKKDTTKFYKEYSGIVNPNGGHYVQSGFWKKKFQFGFEASPNIIALRGNDIIKEYHKSTIGFSGGIFLQLNLKNKFSLRTNLSFDRKGSKANLKVYDSYQNTIKVISVKSKLDYLTLPILVKATFGYKYRLTIGAGPYLGYLIKQTYLVNDGESPERKENKSLINKFDLGLSAGIGFAIPINEKFEFSFEIKNDLGLFNVSAFPVVNDGAIKTNSLKFLIGGAYKFDLKKNTKN